MHAKAQSTKCEVLHILYHTIWNGFYIDVIVNAGLQLFIKESGLTGKNQNGAGTTSGKEIEKVNNYLSCCSLTTSYMMKSDHG